MDEIIEALDPNDRVGMICPECDQGTLQTRSLYDEWDSKVTCGVCGFNISRFIE